MPILWFGGFNVAGTFIISFFLYVRDCLVWSTGRSHFAVFVALFAYDTALQVSATFFAF